MKISKRAKKSSASPIRSLAAPQGVTVHRLNIGQPDIESPKEFIAALKHLNTNVIAYEASSGNKHLIAQWVKFFNTRYDIGVTKNEMLITAGSSEALTFALSACCDVNDEVLVFSPTYANYTGFATIAGVKLTSIECSFDEKFHISVTQAEIEEQISKKTKAILICNPNNPTGTVFTDTELQMLLAVCEKHDLFLLVDEVYREFVYGDKPAQCIFQLSPKNERIVLIDSLSKRYSLCGARIGCLLSWNVDFMKAVLNFASTRVSAPTIEQKAAAHMLHHLPEDYLITVTREYKERRDVLIEELSKIEGVECVTPEGGFYVLVKLPVDDAEKFAQFMLQEFHVNHETVFVAPAKTFFINETARNSYVRIAIVLEKQILQKAVELLALGLLEYQKIK